MGLNSLKNYFKESLIYKKTRDLNTAYQHSYLKKALLSTGMCLENSVFLSYLSGRGREFQAYENSLLYKMLQGMIIRLDILFKGLSHHYHTAKLSSSASILAGDAGKKLQDRPLKGLAFIVLGFSLGFLIFNPRPLFAAGLLIVNAGIFILAIPDVKLEQVLQGSLFYNLWRYLLE